MKQWYALYVSLYFYYSYRCPPVPYSVWVTRHQQQHWLMCRKCSIYRQYLPGIILCMRLANERRRYNVTSSLIGWAHPQKDPWYTPCCINPSDAATEIIRSIAWLLMPWLPCVAGSVVTIVLTLKETRDPGIVWGKISSFQPLVPSQRRKCRQSWF